MFYVGQAGSAVYQALQLAGFVFVEQPTTADTIILDGRLPPETTATQIADRLRQGGGLVLIMGPGLPANRLENLVPGSGIDGRAREPETLWVPESALPGTIPDGQRPVSVLTQEISWRSAPQIRARVILQGRDLLARVQTWRGHNTVVGYQRVGAGRVYWLTAWLDAGHNRDFREWPYFNYLIYVITTEAAGQQAVPFAAFRGAPLPQQGERVFLFLFVLASSGFAVALFLWARRRTGKVSDLALFRTAKTGQQTRHEGRLWEQVGFHRPLAGFLVLLVWGLVFFIPFILYQTVILPRYLLPSPQALGAWSLVVNFFNAFWLLFDMGTSLAAIKFLSEYRRDDPFRGLQFVQFYVWWQMITGSIQVGTVILIAVYLLPHTAYAYLSFYVIAHAMIQFPGFSRVFQYVLRALQRLDYDQWLNVAVQPAPGGTGPGSLGFLLIPLQAVGVWAMYRWGMHHPRFGASMGGALGMGVGLYLAEVAVFIAGGWLYKRLGFPLRWLFLAQFDRQIAREALRYGALISLGGVTGALGWATQAWLMERYLFNYTEIQGNWSVASGLILAFGALAGLYQGMMPAISEAYSHRCFHLARYYLAQGFKYGGWLSIFVASALLATGDRLIIGTLGPQWVRAAEVLSILIVWGTLQFPAWFADQVQQGTGHTGLFASMLFLEQMLRIVLMVALLPSLQIGGLIIAYLIALPVKDVCTWVLTGRLIVRPRIHWWQTVVAPLLAGGTNYVLFRGLGAWLWDGKLLSSLLLFVLASGPGLFWYAFWSGFFGGWDNWGLVELRRAGRSSLLSRPIGIPLERAIAAGARLGPWHGRFPIRLDRYARQEARQLTAVFAGKDAI